MQSGMRSSTTFGMKKKDTNIDGKMRMKKVRMGRMQNYNRPIAES